MSEDLWWRGAELVSDLPSEYVVIDTETTGLGKKDKVIEVALARVKDGHIVDRFVRLINPQGRKIHPRAAEVNGFSDESVSHVREPAKHVKDLEGWAGLGLPWLAWNARFDKRLMQQTFGTLGTHNWIDSVQWVCVAEIFRARNGSLPRQTEAATKLHVVLEGNNVRAHNAYGDVLLLKGIVEAMRREDVLARAPTTLALGMQDVAALIIARDTFRDRMVEAIAAQRAAQRAEGRAYGFGIAAACLLILVEYFL